MLAIVTFAAAGASTAPVRTQLTRAAIDQMIKSLSNWGRWGKDDQLGALNLITPAKRKEAAALVNEGVSLSLAHNVIKVKAFGSPGFQHDMVKKVGSGDAILIRTGRWTRYTVEGEWDALSNSPGLDVSCMPWLKKRDVAVLGSDLASDVMPSGVRGTGPGFLPVHLIAIFALGLPILDNCDFEALSAAAAARQRWTFLLTVAPLAVEGGTGSPVNPIATF
jgi:kynurenine formamidase